MNPFSKLEAHIQTLKNLTLPELRERDCGLLKKKIITIDGLEADFSKHYATHETYKHFETIASHFNLFERIDHLFSGKPVNFTEKRPALHTALRAPTNTKIMVGGTNVMEAIGKTHLKMAKFVSDIHDGRWKGFQGDEITDIVNIGIGGSDLGPRMVTEALKPLHHPRIRSHFIANLDGTELYDILKQVSLPQTLFIIASKTFSSQETLENALSAKQWFLDHTDASSQDLSKHFVAVTANIAQAQAFGIDPQQCFELWDFVGGRFSLWSSIGLSIALATSMAHFQALLRGAHAMDYHFQNAPVSENIPMLMAFFTLIYQRYFNSHSQAIIPYSHRLQNFLPYIQQLDMESLGKSVNHEGQAISTETGQIIWGGVGSNSQHAFHQLLYQGQHFIPIEFIIPKSTDHPFPHHQKQLIAHCVAQSQALLEGKTEGEALQELLAEGMPKNEAEQLAPFKKIKGGLPSTTLWLETIAPFHLGQLIALYEHKVYTLSLLWDINAFDQFGVELGKAFWNNVMKQGKDNK